MIWRNRDFMMLTGGETISGAGSAIAWLAFPLVGYALTHSYTEAALAGTANTLGSTICRVPAGALADRWSRRRVLLTADVALLVVFGLLAVGLAMHRLSLAELVIGALVSAIASAFFGPAAAAATRTVVPAQQLPQALSLNEGVDHGCMLIGPPVGGLLYSVSAGLPFGANAVSYLASLAGITLIRAPLAAPARPPGAARPRLRREIADGLRFVWSRGFFRAFLASAALMNFASAALFLVLTLKLDHAGVRPAAIGLVYTLGAVGGLLGAGAAPALVKRIPTGLLSVLAGTVAGLALIPIAFSDNVAVVGAWTAGALFCIPACNAAIGAYQMAVTPDRFQARMASAIGFGTSALLPFAPLVGGLALTLVGGETAMLVLAILTAAGGLVLLASREVRRLPVPSRWPAGERAEV